MGEHNRRTLWGSVSQINRSIFKSQPTIDPNSNKKKKTPSFERPPSFEEPPNTMSLTNLDNTETPSYTTFLVAFASALAVVALMYAALHHCLWIDRRRYQTTGPRPIEPVGRRMSSVRFVRYGEDSEEEEEGVELEALPMPPPPAVIRRTRSASFARYPPPAPPPTAPLPPLPRRLSPTPPPLSQEQEEELQRIYDDAFRSPSPIYSLPSAKSREY